MCRGIITADSRHLRTVRDLREAWCVEPVIEDGYGALPPDCCLCPVDIEATAEKAGRAVDYFPDLEPLDWVEVQA